MGDIAEETGKTYGQIASTVASSTGVVAVTIGARPLPQLDDHLGAVGWELTADQVRRLDQVSDPPSLGAYPNRPYRSRRRMWAEESVTQTVRPTAVAQKGRATEFQAKQARLAWLMLTPPSLPSLRGLVPVWAHLLRQPDGRELRSGDDPLHRVTELPEPHRQYSMVGLRPGDIEVHGHHGRLRVRAGHDHCPGGELELRGRRALRAAMLVPWTSSPLSTPDVEVDVQRHDGVFNDILERLGIIQTGISWTTSTSTSLASVSVIDIWKTTPFVALLLLAGMQLIPGDVYGAARVMVRTDGSSPGE